MKIKIVNRSIHSCPAYETDATSGMDLRVYLFVFLSIWILFAGCKPRQETLPFDPGDVEQYQPGKLEDQGITAMFIEGKKEALLGNYIKAEAMFMAVIQKDDRRDAAYYELASLYIRQNNLTDAQIMARKAVELDPANQWYKLILGEIYQRNQNYADAAKIYLELSRDNPHNLEYRFQLAASYVYAGKFNEALVELDKIESQMGISEEIIRQKEKLYIYLKKVDQAAAEVQKLIQAFPGESRYYSWLAELYISNGMPEKALPVYQTIVSKFPDDPYIHISLSDYYRKRGQDDLAFNELKLGFENPNLDIDTKIQVMLAYYSVSELFEEIRPQAMELAEILIRIHPDNPKSYSMYADFLVRDGRYPEARDAFRRVITMDSSKFLVWESLLRVEAELADYEAMQSESRRMIDLFPVQPLGYLFNGVALMQLRDYQAAIESFNSGSNYVVGNNLLMAQFNAYLGDANYQVGNVKAAFEHYDKTLKIDPGNSYVLNNYAYYLSLQGENLEKAEAMARKATELDSLNSANMDTYGWVLFRLGKYGQAEEWIKKALDNGGLTNAVLLEHYGDVLFKLGRDTEAADYWKKAMEAGTGSDLLEKKVKDGTYYE